MPTKSEVVFQRALHFRQLVSEINIKHYAQGQFSDIVHEIFSDTFKDEMRTIYDSSGKTLDEDHEYNQPELNGEDERRGERDRRDDYNDNCNPMTR